MRWKAVRLPGVTPRIAVSAHPWAAGVVLGCLCLAAGVWGYAAEDAANQNLLEAITYLWLPLAVFAFFVASRVWRSKAILVAVGLLDVEAALLGAGPLIALPFVAVVPLVSVAVAAQLIPRSRLKIPYVAAWIASSVAVAIAVLRIVDIVAPSALAVIPAFMFVDAVALVTLWRLDASRLSAFDAAAAAEARATDLLNGVDLVGVHVGRHSGIDFINDYALKLTGWTRDELLGANWWDTFAPAERREAARANFELVASGLRVMDRKRESTLMTKSGEVRLIRWSHVQRYDSKGRLTGVASLGEDVTELRAVEEAARRGAEMLSKLVVSSPLPTVILGLDRTVQLWNPAAADLLGWTEDEVIGRTMPSIYLGRDQWAIARSFALAVRGRPMDSEPLEVTRRDGQVICVRLYGEVLLDREGKPMAVGFQAIDRTEALETEQKLRDAQKMEAIGRLAGGVAHDFNNSLTAIGGFASLIASGSNEPETVAAAETILGAATHAADLTRELLAYSRRAMLQPQLVEVNGLVNGLFQPIERLVGDRVSVKVESRLRTAMIDVDRAGLQRALLNLASNARDAMPEGGCLTISIFRRAVEGSTDGDATGWVGIAVTDTGIGIAPELHSQVFDPFFTTKPVGSGTGLGLAMVKGFVVQSGGKVALVSGPDSGTRIEILLPAAGAGVHVRPS